MRHFNKKICFNLHLSELSRNYFYVKYFIPKTLTPNLKNSIPKTPKVLIYYFLAIFENSTYFKS
jgi:hypothetical protein